MTRGFERFLVLGNLAVERIGIVCGFSLEFGKIEPGARGGIGAVRDITGCLRVSCSSRPSRTSASMCSSASMAFAKA